MDKQLKKQIESELIRITTTALSTRSKTAAAKIAKHIKEGSKRLAKKFVKGIPKPASTKKKSTAKKKVAVKRKSSVKKVKSGQPAVKKASVKK